MPAAMLVWASSGDLISPHRALRIAKVEGMICMIPRAPTALVAAESRPLSAIACALNSRHANPGPKYRLLYFRK